MRKHSPEGASCYHQQKARKRTAAVCGATAAARQGYAFSAILKRVRHPHALRLVLRTQPRSGGSKMCPWLIALLSFLWVTASTAAELAVKVADKEPPKELDASIRAKLQTKTVQ